MREKQGEAGRMGSVGGSDRANRAYIIDRTGWVDGASEMMGDRPFTRACHQIVKNQSACEMRHTSPVIRSAQHAAFVGRHK